MSNNLYLFIANVLVSSGLVGAGVWLLKRFLTRRIENIFSEREKLLESRLRVYEKYEDRLLDFRISILPQIQEVVYRSRNLVKEIVRTSDLYTSESLFAQWQTLCDQLYKYQLFVTEDTFKNLHDYKADLQNITLMLVSLKQQKIETNGQISQEPTTVPKKEIAVIKNSIPALETKYNKAIDSLRSEIKYREIVNR
jgi:hypothetical protein